MRYKTKSTRYCVLDYKDTYIQYIFLNKKIESLYGRIFYTTQISKGLKLHYVSIGNSDYKMFLDSEVYITYSSIYAANKSAIFEKAILNDKN